MYVRRIKKLHKKLMEKETLLFSFAKYVTNEELVGYACIFK